MTTVTQLVTIDDLTYGYPNSLTLDGNGNLILSMSSSSPQPGDILEVANNATGYATTTTILGTLSLQFGIVSTPGLIHDAAGNLFGITDAGGVNGAGQVFEIPKTSSGYGSLTTIASLTTADGSTPTALYLDKAGNLIGATEYGGAYGSGSVFEIARTNTSYDSTPTIVVNRSGESSQLIADAAGNLIGVDPFGNVDQIAKTVNGYATTETIISLSNSNQFAVAMGALAQDAAGDLFGYVSGSGFGNESIYEITKTQNGFGTINYLYNAENIASNNSVTGLIIDAKGNIFFTVAFGGTNYDGLMLELAKTSSGYASAPTTIATIHDPSNLTADAAGDLFVITTNSGTNKSGLVEITGSGFQPLCFCAGTHIATPDVARPVEALSVGDLVRLADARRRAADHRARLRRSAEELPHPHRKWRAWGRAAGARPTALARARAVSGWASGVCRRTG